MANSKKLSTALFSLRVSVFLVMLMWTLDKFVRPEHASQVFQQFYKTPGFGQGVSYIIGGVELVIILAFLVGFKKRLSYGLVLAFHAISTLSAFPQYLDPFEGPNLLFFAAWPMLAACYTLFAMRAEDRLFNLGNRYP